MRVRPLRPARALETRGRRDTRVDHLVLKFQRRGVVEPEQLEVEELDGADREVRRRVPEVQLRLERVEEVVERVA